MTKVERKFQGIGKRREKQLAYAYGIDVDPGQVPPSMMEGSLKEKAKGQKLLKRLSEHKRQAYIKEDFDRIFQHESQNWKFKRANEVARLKRIACYRGIRANRPMARKQTGTNA